MLERTIKANIVYWLKERGVLCWRAGAGAYAPAGVPDILGVLPGGVLLGIEVKTPQKRTNVSQVQKQWLYDLKRHGAVAFVATSIEDVKRELAGRL